MRIIDEIMTYNGLLANEEELYEKMRIITNEANSRICQATGIPPILVFKREKEHLLLLTKIQQYQRKLIQMLYLNIKEIYILFLKISLIKISL